MITVRAKRSLTIFLTAVLSSLLLSGVLYLCTRLPFVWPFFFIGVGLLLAALVMHFLGCHHFGRGFFCVTIALSAVACGFLISSFFNHKDMGSNIGITDLFFSYILFTGFCLMFSIAFVYIKRKIFFCVLSAVLLAASCFLCRMLVRTEAVSPLFYILGLFYFFYLCSFFFRSCFATIGDAVYCTVCPYPAFFPYL